MNDWIECLYCGRSFDIGNDGHIDEETDLSFCSPECEMNYDREFGLPENYNRCGTHET